MSGEAMSGEETTAGRLRGPDALAGAPSVIGRVLLYTILLSVAAVILVPLLYAILGGFRTTGQIAADPLGLPDPWLVENYTRVLASATFWQSLANSVLIAAITTLVVLAASSLAAFTFARFAFRGREVLFMLFTLGLLFPVAVAILPLFLLVRGLGLLDSPLGVALPQAAFALPVTILILRPFFRSIPAELEDAAAIDGCSRFGFFWRILLPLSRPALVTVAVLALVGSWNAFLLPLVVLSDPAMATLPLGVSDYSTQYSQDTAGVLAFTTLAMLPALGFYLVAERQIVGGLASGAVKG
jgi:raffinose/stachyose/melibiose transport system permease protein